MNAASRLVRAPNGKTAGSSPFQSSTSRNWLDRLLRSDSEFILRQLGTIVARHPLVKRGLLGSGFVTGAGIADLVQDLYLELHRKGRFRCYLTREMTDLQIEREILHLELANILAGRLRRERPEHYRLARRIGEVLDSDSRFSRLGSGGTGACRVSERLYGLASWPPGKRSWSSGDLLEAIGEIPVCQRDRRRRGGGGSQVVVSNSDLVRLLEAILQRVDSPLPRRVIRHLALTRLSLNDPLLTSLDEIESVRWSREESPRRSRILAIDDRTPESRLIEREQSVRARRKADEFVERLAVLVRHDPRKLDRILQVVWHLYFDPQMPTQIEIARLVGLSDSSISNYRQRIERELSSISLVIEQGPDFVESLEERLEWCRVSAGSQPSNEDRVTRVGEWRMGGLGRLPSSILDNAVQTSPPIH